MNFGDTLFVREFIVKVREVRKQNAIVRTHTLVNISVRPLLENQDL